MKGRSLNSADLVVPPVQRSVTGAASADHRRGLVVGRDSGDCLGADLGKLEPEVAVGAVTAVVAAAGAGVAVVVIGLVAVG